MGTPNAETEWFTSTGITWTDSRARAFERVLVEAYERQWEFLGIFGTDVGVHANRVDWSGPPAVFVRHFLDEVAKAGKLPDFIRRVLEDSSRRPFHSSIAQLLLPETLPLPSGETIIIILKGDSRSLKPAIKLQIIDSLRALVESNNLDIQIKNGSIRLVCTGSPKALATLECLYAAGYLQKVHTFGVVGAAVERRIEVPSNIVHPETEDTSSSENTLDRGGATLPGWWSTVVMLCLRPAALYDRLCVLTPDVLSTPYFLASSLLGTKKISPEFRDASKRLSVAFLAAVPILTLAYSACIWTMLSPVVQFLKYRGVLPADVIPPEFHLVGLGSGLLAGLMLGTILSVSLGFAVGAVGGISAGLSLGMHVAEGSLVASAMSWGITVGLALSLFPPLQWGKRLSTYRCFVVSLGATLVFAFCARFWSTSPAGFGEPLLPGDVLGSSIVFLLSSLLAILRLPLNIAFLVASPFVRALPQEEWAFVFLGMVHYGEDLHIPLPWVKTALTHLQKTSPEQLPEALEDLRRSVAHEHLATSSEKRPTEG